MRSQSDQKQETSTSWQSISQSCFTKLATNGFSVYMRTLLILGRNCASDNFIATSEQPRNKYDLERIRDRKNDPLCDYIQRFSNMCLKIPKISHDEAISAFIKGLRFHEALRSKLPRSPNFLPQPRTTPMPMTQRSLSERTYEEPSSLPDETTAVDASTSGTPAVATTASTEKGGTDGVTIVTISEASDLAITIMR